MAVAKMSVSNFNLFTIYNHTTHNYRTTVFVFLCSVLMWSTLLFYVFYFSAGLRGCYCGCDCGLCEDEYKRWMRGCLNKDRRALDSIYYSNCHKYKFFIVLFTHNQIYEPHTHESLFLLYRDKTTEEEEQNNLINTLKVVHLNLFKCNKNKSQDTRGGKRVAGRMHGLIIPELSKQRPKTY
jgi:hypothetical protein